VARHIQQAGKFGVVVAACCDGGSTVQQIPAFKGRKPGWMHGKSVCFVVYFRTQDTKAHCWRPVLGPVLVPVPVLEPVLGPVLRVEPAFGPVIACFPFEAACLAGTGHRGCGRLCFASNRGGYRWLRQGSDDSRVGDLAFYKACSFLAFAAPTGLTFQARLYGAFRAVWSRCV
jgi:hypothetical protein